MGKDLAIAYASRILNQTGTDYSTAEKELPAVLWSVNRFRPCLHGRTFVSVTDHGALTCSLNCKGRGSPQVKRVRLPNRVQRDAQSLNVPVDIAISKDKFREFIEFHYKTTN